MRVVMHRGRVSIVDFCERRSVYEGCSEDFLYLLFSFHFRYIIFVHWSCDHLVIANLVLMLIYILRLLLLFFTYLYMCCFFSLFMHMILITCMQSFYFCFTLRCRDEFCLKCFRNISCQSLPCHELSSCKVFQEFMLG